MPIAKVSEKGWVVIPKELRKKYGIKPGGRVHLVDLGERLYIMPVPDDPIAAGYGMFKDDGPSWTAEIVEQHRREREAEEAEIAHWAGGVRDSE
jgi:AbrB family looped-hinge helix DNA binding protein